MQDKKTTGSRKKAKKPNSLLQKQQEEEESDLRIREMLSGEQALAERLDLDFSGNL